MVGHQMNAVILLICAVYIAAQQTTIDSRYRVDCFPEPNSTSTSCEQRGCIWDQNPSIATAPQCYFPHGTGYEVMSVNDDEIVLTKSVDPSPGNAMNPYGSDISPLTFRKRYYGATLNIRIEPLSGALKRFEPDVELERVSSYSTDSLYVETDTRDIFAFSVRRTSTQTTLFNNALGGGLMFSDKYIQLASYFASENVYGFGENAHHAIKHDLSRYTTWAMLARDEGPNSYGLDTKNLYGVFAFYICVEYDGNAHGVLIVNSNPQEITTGPGPHFIYRTIGGMLDMYFFPGPTPEEVVKQYEVLVGRPTMPAYWALGYQLCRYGYKSLADQEDAIRRTQQAGIPLDAPNFDIDYMNRYMDFTTGSNWQNLGQFVNQLHNEGLHVILIFDPAIDVSSDPFRRARQQDAAFIEWPRTDLVQTEIQNLYDTTMGTKIMLGVVWPDHHAAFPDFSDPQPNTVDWWIDEYRLYYKSVQFDGLWIDMNEPASFGTNEQKPWYFDNPDHPNIVSLKCNVFNASDSEYDYPPFKTQSVYIYGAEAALSTKTVCMLGTTGRGKNRQYDTKNLYGLYEAKATMRALHEVTQKRGVVVSRSMFPTAGRYAGHWLGDNQASWETLVTTIVGVQEFNMFGIPYVGSDICGYSGDTTEELCLRWHQLGAFHPFSRNHNNNNAVPQDPAQWPSVAAATRKAYLFRYRYLPYLYSLHFAASRNGGTVVRPVFFEFPKDQKTLDLGMQFMWGSGLMIVPVIEKGAVSVSAYLPSTATWYSLRDADYGANVRSGVMSATTNELIPVLVRGGVIIPRQVPSTTTTASRKNPFELLIAVDPTTNSADGFFYWDDGDGIITDFGTYPYYEFHFTFTSNTQTSKLTITQISKGNIPMPTLDSIDILGLPHVPDLATVTYMGQNVDMSDSSYDASKQLFKIRRQGLMALDKQPYNAELVWSNEGESSSTTTYRPSKLVTFIPIIVLIAVAYATHYFV